VGCEDGEVGAEEGCDDGRLVGCELGLTEGVEEGCVEGWPDGMVLGCELGVRMYPYKMYTTLSVRGLPFREVTNISVRPSLLMSPAEPKTVPAPALTAAPKII
jgi:hypothetical protein